MEGKNLLDRYRMFEELGRGGKGVVYRARDQVLEREVAIKIILPKTMTPDSRRRFRREARTTASLDHPAITPIYDFGQHDDELFIVMPLLSGRTLRILIESGPLDPRKAIEILIQIADALDYSHGRGVIHRDVKPENIMVGWHRHRLPQVKVLDFGLAAHIGDAQLAEAQTVEGTPLYISPEQLIGEEIDPGSDIYSLGMVLYECLAGEHPLKAGEGTVFQRVLFEEPGSLRARGVAISEILDHLILSCLAKEKGDRPRSAREVLRSLIDARRALEAAPSASPAPKAWPARDAAACEEPRFDESGSETSVHRRPAAEQPLPAEEL